jgi:hypothetical protein
LSKLGACKAKAGVADHVWSLEEVVALLNYGVSKIAMLLSLLAFLLVASNADAHPQPPITAYVQRSETVCIVKATSLDKNVVTFLVEEVVKGKPPTVLKLGIAGEPVAITLGSEWLLASTGASEESVGWADEGDYGWVNAPIVRVDGKPFLVGNYGYLEPKVGQDESKGMSLDQLKKLAKEPPTNDLRSISLPVPH